MHMYTPSQAQKQEVSENSGSWPALGEMAQKAKKEGENVEKPSIATKEKRSPTERRETIEDQRFAKKKGEVSIGYM